MNPYIQSLRLRTLPLSVSGIILGTGLAFGGQLSAVSCPQWTVFGFALATTLCLQILSNLANELGDAQKGTDADQHGRAAYGLQAGTITPKQIKGMIGLFAGLSVGCGLALIYCAFGSLFATQSLVFIGLGLLAVIGAVTYTLGKHSYGYHGWGDLSVFLFFGLLSTLGAYYLQTQTMTEEVIWCGAAIGLPCVGVLNINNIRDMDNDRAHGKRTFASLLGKRGGKVYHLVLLVGCLAVFVTYGHYWVLLVAPVWGWQVYYLFTHDNSALDKQMPVLMFSTLAVALLALA
jgi:1,4-dihydroxy-2-naphthoate octaprenyltransferase